MKKKLSILLFAIVMVLFMSATVFADDAPTTLYIGGQAITGSGQITGADITGTVYYDASTNTLTLNNASVYAAYSVKEKGYGGKQRDYSIYCLGGDLNINLVGDNTLGYNVYGDSDCEIEFLGNGSVSIYGSTPGFFDTQYTIECDEITIGQKTSVTVDMHVFSGRSYKPGVAIKVDEIDVFGTLIAKSNDSTYSAVDAKEIYLANGSTMKITGTYAAIKAGTNISKGDKIKIIAGSSSSTATTCTVENLGGKKYVEASNTAKGKSGTVVEPVTIDSVTAGKKSITIVWVKNEDASGYQVRYSTSSSMKNAKTGTTNKASNNKVTISKLKAKKKYYVQVRAFKKVNGKNKYSSWSKKRSVTTK